MKRQFIVLRVVSVLFKVGATLMLLLGLAALAFGLGRLIAFANGNGGIMGWVQVGAALAVAIWSTVQFMVLYAIGETLNVLMAIEENTRATSMRIVRLLALLSEEEKAAG